uniref:C-type lectin domain-containing protein n=1 Tax=Cyprinus carpio TaxID=7962 RepID=A0A8C2G9Y5_CYPCA
MYREGGNSTDTIYVNDVIRAYFLTEKIKVDTADILKPDGVGLMSVNGSKRLTAELVLLTVGWTCYQSSFYFMSTEKKNWTESRRYCKERGADLIIINNREEKDFVHNTSGNAVFYIGLTDTDVEGTWKWVDNSTLTSSFWASGQPDGGQGIVDEDCVVTVAVPPAEWPNLVGWISQFILAIGTSHTFLTSSTIQNFCNN